VTLRDYDSGVGIAAPEGVYDVSRECQEQVGPILKTFENSFGKTSVWKIVVNR
jgi:hypothetical protein